MSETKVKRVKSEQDKSVEETRIVQSKSPIDIATELLKAGGEHEIANLDKILDIQQKYEAIQAMKAYNQAMADFKANPPKIIKDRTVSYRAGSGTTQYNHATLANVTSCINEALSTHGLTASWETAQNNGTITVTCKITHVMGHSQSTSLTAQPDSSGSKNPIQAIGSTVTYLERYTLLALTGLATYEQDDDGGKPEQPTPAEKSMEYVDEAYKKYCEKYKDMLAEGFEFNKDKFIKAIYQEWQGLPTNKQSVQKILNKIKPEAAIIEIAKASDGTQDNLYG